MKNDFNLKPTFVALLLSCAVLSSCSDAITPSGGASGDSEESPAVRAAIELLQPFVGVYDLQDNWTGNEADQAFLSIRLTGSDGTSEAALIDVDDTENCIPRRPSIGEVRKDPFSNRVFLDDISDFTDAELTLEGNTLIVESVDTFDIDDDGNRSESVFIQAQRVAIMENDLGTPCS